MTELTRQREDFPAENGALPEPSGTPSVAEPARSGGDGSGLPDPADPSPGLVGVFREMACELIVYRELLWQIVLRDVRIRYKQAVMGFGWALFMPMMVVAAGFLVKYAMARVSGQPLQTAAVAGMAVKALAWSFFAGALGFSTASLTSNIALVTKIYFPREVFPLSAVLVQAFDSAIGASVLAAMLVLIPGVGLSLAALWALPLLVLLVLLAFGTALLLSCANVFFRDVKYVAQVIITFGIFFTPVFYEPEFFGPTGGFLMMLNPLAPLLEGLRLAVVEHQGLLAAISHPADGAEMLIWTPWYLAYSASWALLGTLGAWWLFHRMEFLYAEYI